MKTKVLTIIFLIANLHLLVAQLKVFCGGQPLAVDTENNILFYNTEDCDENIYITIEDDYEDDIAIEGTILTSKSSKSAFIKGNIGKSIYIKPPNSSGNIVLVGNTNLQNRQMPAESRSSVGVSKQEGKEEVDQPKEEITIYPNPADEVLNITMSENGTIITYKVMGSYGTIMLEGTSLTNNAISVDSLSTGLYYLVVQTQQSLLTKTFYKN